MSARSVALALLLGLVPAAAHAGAPLEAGTTRPSTPTDSTRAYARMVARVAGMVDDERAWRVAEAARLSLVNVMWEDTGRWEGSSVGPNISDVTIEVEAPGKRNRTYLMPVMRHDNFTDKTADVPMDEIMIPVGNHDGGALEVVSLTELLAHPSEFLSAPDSGTIKGGSLLAPKRDSHVLVSAQHAFLPVPHEGQAKFWPVIFNYQSSKKNPAVLTILVTRQGTSISIVDNAHDVVGNDSWGQRLYFNDGGERAPLIAERMADVQASGVTANGESAASLGDDANVLMLIQVPLKLRRVRPSEPMYGGAGVTASSKPAAAPASDASVKTKGDGGGRSGVDMAVLGHGPSDGPFTELAGLTIARDPRFPVRVTLQFYQATTNGVLSRADGKAMAAQIKKVYRQGDFVGSLVVPTEADRRRPTNWDGHTVAPVAIDWRAFPGLAEHIGIAMRVRAGMF